MAGFGLAGDYTVNSTGAREALPMSPTRSVLRPSAEIEVREGHNSGAIAAPRNAEIAFRRSLTPA